MAKTLLPNLLEKRLRDPLPGFKKQLELAPVDGPAYMEPMKGYREASVMLLLYVADNQWKLTYIKRTSHNPNDRHAGQISFPGGKKDLTDDSNLACALRETEEEIGIDRNSINVIGALTSLYVHVSNFLVYPYVGFVENKPEFIPQESEVANIYTPSLEYLSNDEILKIGDVSARGMTIKNMPYFDLHGMILWGATAMITSEFLTIYKEVIEDSI